MLRFFFFKPSCYLSYLPEMMDIRTLLHLNCFYRVRNNSIEIFLNSLPHNIILYEGYIFSLYRSLFPALLSNN